MHAIGVVLILAAAIIYEGEHGGTYPPDPTVQYDEGSLPPPRQHLAPPSSDAPPPDPIITPLDLTEPQP